jgi:predicted MFS family arabinose efflux permease
VRRRVTVDLSVLRESRGLRLVVAGEALSGLGTQAALVAIPYQVYVLTRSAFLVGLLGVVELGPLVATSLLGGVVADRLDRRKVLLAAQALVCAVAAALALTASVREPPVVLVFVLAAVLAGVAAVDNVTRAAVVPQLVGPERLRPALGLTFGLGQVSSVVGPGLGGLLIAAFGVASAYWIDTAAFAATLLITRALSPLPPARGAGPPESVARSLAEGLRFVRGNRALMGSFAIDLAAMTFGMPRALFAVLSLTVYDAGAAGTGALYTAVSAGALVAALTTGWLEHARRLGRIVIGAVLVWGACIAAAGVVHHLWAAAALLAAAGAADSVSAVCRTTINQTVTPEPLRGRMSSVFMLVVTSGPRLGDLESGLAASVTSAGAAVFTGGLACIAAAGLVVLAFPALAAYDGGAPAAAAGEGAEPVAA